MLNIEKRIAALESSASDDAIKIVIVDDGETQADALRRTGCSAGVLGVVFITQIDAML